MAKLDENGHEILDPTPVAIPVRFKRSESLTDQMRRLIREEASRVAQNAGFETFEEADDFSVEDDYDPRSPHEMTLEQELEGYGDRDEGGTTTGTEPPREGEGKTGGELSESGKTPAEPPKEKDGTAGGDS